MPSRIFTVRLNLDELRADLAVLDGDAEQAAWLRGFNAGASGVPSRWERTSPAGLGHARGAAGYAEACAFQERQADAGKASAAARAAATGTSQPKRPSEPITERRSKNGSNQSPNRTPNAVRTTVRTNDRTALEPIHQSRDPDIEREEKEAAAAAVPRGTPVESEDPRLEAAAALGAYLTINGQDARPQWLIAVDGQTVEQVREVMAHGRQRDGKPVRVPPVYIDHRHDLVVTRTAAVLTQQQQAAENAVRARFAAQQAKAAGEASRAAAECRARAKRVLDYLATASGEFGPIEQHLRHAYDTNAMTLRGLVDGLPAELRRIANGETPP